MAFTPILQALDLLLAPILPTGIRWLIGLFNIKRFLFHASARDISIRVFVHGIAGILKTGRMENIMTGCLPAPSHLVHRTLALLHLTNGTRAHKSNQLYHSRQHHLATWIIGQKIPTIISPGLDTG